MVRGRAPITTGFYLGQCAALGSWLIDGTRHRLERAAVFVLATVALSYLIWEATGANSFGRILAPVSLYEIAVAACSLLFQLTFRGLRIHGEVAGNRTIRFPLIELFGWTMVVAIASTFIRNATFLTFLNDTNLLFEFFASAALIGAWSAAFASRERKYYGVKWLLILGSIAFYAWALNTADDLGMILSLIIAHLYAAVWIWVLRLAAPSVARTEPDTDSDVQTIPLSPADPHETVQ